MYKQVSSKTAPVNGFIITNVAFVHLLFGNVFVSELVTFEIAFLASSVITEITFIHRYVRVAQIRPPDIFRSTFIRVVERFIFQTQEGGVTEKILYSA